ncbi:MAG: NTP transferase domain-containing protein [candidate division Zixibacteria bacterium]|nr:NTP transferase domain-containing protein [candidate division Zixibacteria bacterium]
MADVKAMVFAAGLGTRLKPLTDARPKALVEVRGKPLLYWILKRLARHGFTDIVVNTHHFAEQIDAFVKNFLAHPAHTGIRISLSRETTLLDTGGGLWHAAHFFNDDAPFLVQAVDILTDLDLSALMAAHRMSGDRVTIAVKRRVGTRFFLFDETRRLCGWESTDTGVRRMVCQPSSEPESWPSMVVQAVSPVIFSKWRDPRPISLTDVYLELAEAGEPISAFRVDDAVRWMDVGRIPHLSQAETYFGAAYFDDLEVFDTSRPAKIGVG